MAEYKGAAKEGARAMALMKKREKMKADIEAAKNKISEVCFLLREFCFFFLNFASMAIKITQWLFVRHPYGDLYLLFVRESEDFMGFLCNS